MCVMVAFLVSTQFAYKCRELFIDDTFIIFTFPALHKVIKLAKEHMCIRTVFKI